MNENNLAANNASINQGLDGVVVAATEISDVNGIKGELIYSGYMLEELIQKQCSYEDVLYLFLRKKLPSAAESQAFTADLANRRLLSTELIHMIDAIPRNLDYMDAFRTGISALGCEMDTSYPPTEEQALNLIAKAPIIVNRYYRLKTKQDIFPQNPTFSHAANYLYLLTGQTPETVVGKAYAKALDTYFITTIEHAMNASTFTARVAISTQSDLVSAITAAISTLKGPLHGGAPLEVIHMLEAIGSIENAEPWIRNVLEHEGRLMGFGHRVYKSYDPRAKALQDVVATLPSTNNQQLELSRHIEKVAVRLLQEYKPGRNLYPNVEFGAAAVLRTVGLPAELYPTTFGIARCGGWTAHILEQSRHNRLIRPSSLYAGKRPAATLPGVSEEK